MHNGNVLPAEHCACEVVTGPFRQMGELSQVQQRMRALHHKHGRGVKGRMGHYS